MGKIKVGIVNYLNTRPLIYGLEKMPVKGEIELIRDYPAKVAEMLLRDEIDIGLVPVAVLNQMPEYHIVGNCCIGTEGEIASVALFSEVPMNEIERVYLDYQSRTSIALLKYLMKEYWGIDPEMIQATGEDYRKKLTGNTAGLVIGDRALEQRKISTFIYDLGSEWRKITGLPFVFAAWASKQPLDPGFIQIFDEANKEGLQHIDEIVANTPYDLYDLNKYFKLHLSYTLDEQKRKGMALFLKYISDMAPGQLSARL